MSSIKHFFLSSQLEPEMRKKSNKEEKQKKKGENQSNQLLFDDLLIRYMLIQEEGIESSKRNVALEIKWNQCREDMEEPQELYKVLYFCLSLMSRRFKSKKRNSKRNDL